MKFNPFSNKKRKEEKLKKKVFGEEKLKLREEVKDITKLSLSEKFALKKKQEEREKELQDIAEGKKIKNLQEVKEKKNIVKKESLKEEKKIDIFKSRNDKIISQEPKKKISFKERFLSKKKKQEKTISERLEEKSGKEDKKNKFKKINESQDIRTKLAKKNKKGKRKKIDYKKGIISIIINRIDIPNFKEYLDKAGLQFEFSTISKGIQTLAIFMNFLLSLFLIFRVYQTKPESIKSLLFFLLVFTIGTCVLIMFIWITLYIIVSIKFRREKNTFGIETNSDVGKRRSFFSNLDKMGINISKKTVLSLYVKLSIILNMVINGYLFYNFTEANPPIIHIIVVSLSIWLLGFILLFILIWILFLVFVDLKIYKRKKEIEEVLPDFLQLAAANISAGMTIDRALWFAVRPRFGVLAKEIEIVVKSTLIGENLNTALLRFSKKYDSVMLQRSINLLLEGLNAGGNVAPLLNKIAINIQETKILKKEMAANVMTYVIFISFAAVGAAPFLFALSTELIVIMQSIMGNIDLGDSGGAMFSIDAEGLNLAEFKIFIYLSMAVTSTFSAIIVSIIKKGNVKDGLQYIPTFIAISYFLYTVAFWMLSSAMGGMF